MKILAVLEKSKDFWFLLGSLFVFFLLRLPSLYEPYWYGDEGIYQTVGMAMRAGRLLYQDIWDNKPPLLYTLYAIFSSEQFTLRLVSLIFGLLSVIVFFYLSKRIFENNKKAVFLSTSIFALFFALPFIEGNIANAENFMLLPIILSGLLIYNLKDSNIQSKIHLPFGLQVTSYKLQVFIAGFLLSFAFLLKIVAVFDFAAFFLFVFFLNFSSKPSIKTLVVRLSPLVIGFFIPILITALFFLTKDALFDFLSASFVQNVGYVGYGNKYLLPQGLLIIKLIILGAFVLFLFQKRKILSRSTLFILLWFSFSLFNAFFAQRPYSHYLLVLLPSLSFMFGLLFYERKYQKLILVTATISIILIAKNFTVYGKTLAYYPNFASFILGEEDIWKYQAFFDRQTPIDYALAQYIKSHTKPSDKIFIWGDNAQIYKMTRKLPPGRYTVAYHMTSSQKSLNQTKEIFYKTRPKYVLVTSWRNPIPFSLNGYVQKLNINDATIYESLF